MIKIKCGERVLQSVIMLLMKDLQVSALVFHLNSASCSISFSCLDLNLANTSIFSPPFSYVTRLFSATPCLAPRVDN